MTDTPADKARALLSDGFLAPLHAAILRAALERALAGDPGELAAALPRMEQKAARAREQSEKAWAEESARRAAAASALLAQHGGAKLGRMLARAEAAQAARYERWCSRRPDERTARKAHLSNALDAGAREIRALKDALELARSA